MKPVGIGIVGCGNISGIYLQRCAQFEFLKILACADLDLERARAAAAKNGIPTACTTDELLRNPQIEVVLNLTVPHAHGPVALAALAAGKSVYNEKPLAVSRADARKMLDLAAKKGLLVGGAPDTFLGGGHQTCRKLIDDGAIGRPVAATAFMTCHGHESWHPSPEFYYEKGGGPMFDMGPYYLTALVNLLGPVKRVTGSARISFPTRTITSQPKNGKVVTVEVPTHVAGVMDFASGAIGTIITSFDVWAAQLPRIEVYGSEGSLSVPDPNGFGGSVRLLRPGSDWQEVALTHGYADNWRGLGVADLARALRQGRKPRAGGDLTYHVLDIMHAFHDASESGRHVQMASTCERPAPLATALREGDVND
ncbi:MAG: 1,5-anhydro-D-fructose reductase [Lentisphaerae bacterium ADurb.BinA184]|nr:MAG: 1,5-anhydro-D-fructose reductase [Lentisphaerae bacterium ADurb.BinA184]